MRKALVLGASGGMGYAIVKELSNRGIMVTAFARNREKLERLFADNNNITIYAGDIFCIEDLDGAAVGMDMIFQSVNIPYSEWKKKLPIIMSNILLTAKKHSTKLAIVDNVYAYGRSLGKKMSETTEKNPHTKKGRIRLEVEKMIKKSEVPALIAHFPDFYGPNVDSILHYTLSTIVKDKNSSFVGNQSIAREYIYTPDGAKAIINLALEDKAYGHNWNIPGYGVISGEEIIKTIRASSGYQKKVSTVTKNMIRFLGLFNRQMREVLEIFYLNEEPVVLNGEKYEELLGPVPCTPYRKGLQQTIDYMRQTQ